MEIRPTHFFSDELQNDQMYNQACKLICLYMLPCSEWMGRRGLLSGRPLDTAELGRSLVCWSTDLQGWSLCMEEETLHFFLTLLSVAEGKYQHIARGYPSHLLQQKIGNLFCESKEMDCVASGS